MIEIEVKIPVYACEEMLKKMAENDFSEGRTVKEEDCYYSGTYHDCRERDEALRIRSVIVKDHSEENHTVITFKGPKLDQISMTRTELETEVGNPEVMDGILQALDYHPAGRVVKQRRYYHRGAMTVCLDDVENLGTFAEFEILAEDETEREQSLVEIRSLMETLGLSFEDTVRTSYLSMLQKKNSDNL